MTPIKLNVLLAKTDHLASAFKKGLEEYVKFFKGSQGAFKGERKTYEPRPGTIDLPNERLNKLVVTTVAEKLQYFQDTSKDYIDALFSQEKTNASGQAKAVLVVDNITFGEFTSMELLRLKSLLEGGTFREMYETMPVRNDDETWAKTTAEMYSGREIFESNQRSGVQKSVMKEAYILPDPNIGKVEGAKYTPQIASKDTVIELGDYTYQRFSGEMSHMDRANILLRRSKLLTATIEALKISNEAETIPSEMTSTKLFNYLHTGKL
jgi:hypothetical protein